MIARAPIVVPGVEVGQTIGTIGNSASVSPVGVKQILGAYATAGQADRAASELAMWNPGSQFGVVATAKPGYHGPSYDYTVVELDAAVSHEDAASWNDGQTDNDVLTKVWGEHGMIDVPDNVREKAWPSPAPMPPGRMPWPPTGGCPNHPSMPIFRHPAVMGAQSVLEEQARLMGQSAQFSEAVADTAGGDAGGMQYAAPSPDGLEDTMA